MAKKQTAALRPPDEDGALAFAAPDETPPAPEAGEVALAGLSGTATDAPPKPIKYVGGVDGDQFWMGVPAVDLTLAEWQAIPADTRDRLIELGLYSIAEGA